MLKLVVDKNPNFGISRVELDSSRPLFTIETMELLSKEYPDYDMLFTIGSDNLKEIHTWEKAEELVTKYKILVLERDEDNMDEIITSNDFLIKHKDSFIKVKNKYNLSGMFDVDIYVNEDYGMIIEINNLSLVNVYLYFR